MVFSWPCVGCKLISVFILPSNTIFRKIERERELSESEIEEEEKGREHTPPASQAPAREIAPRKRSSPEHRADRLRIAPFDFAVRRRRSTSPFDFAILLRLRTDRDRNRSTDSSSPIVNPNLSSPIAIVTPQNQSSSTPKPIVLLLFLLLSIWPNYDFFFPGFYLCFWIEGWNYIFVWQVRKCEKMYFLCDFDFCCCRKIAFSTIQPNTKKYFSQHFLKCNQTLKNIFFSGK